jgi:hypothetical protein
LGRSAICEAARVTVEAIADQFGISFPRSAPGRPPSPVSQLLAQDAQYRLQQVLIPAALLCHCPRTISLTTDHLNTVLATMHMAPLLGYPPDSPTERHQVTVDGSELSFAVDPEISLAELALPRPCCTPALSRFRSTG